MNAPSLFGSFRTSHFFSFIFICVSIVVLLSTQTAYAGGPNLIANPGVETSSTTNTPASWRKGGYGTNVRELTYPVSGYESTKGLRVAITSYTSGDAKWYPNSVSIKGGETYEFTDVYKSNVTSYITVEFKHSDGRLTYYDLGKPGPATTWQTFKATFVAPSTAVSLTIFHLIKGVGYLETDNFYLGTASVNDPTRFDKGYVTIQFDDGVKDTYEKAYPILDRAGFKSNAFIITSRLKENDFPGYVKAAEVLKMAANGHEIGAHTRTHANLPTLSATSARAEIVGSRNDLISIGVTPVNYFAYPYGSYNSTVKQMVKDAGFLGARSSDGGYNLKTGDPFVLKRQPMVNTTTFTTAKRYIDTALAEKTWVILLFHQVDNTGNTYAVTPELFQQIVDYLKEKNVTPITMSEGLARMKQ